MKIIRNIADLVEFRDDLKNCKRSIGFVPTMGSLHDGHLSLVNKAVGECDAVIVSVFVNPTQFNNKSDLLTYPRNEEKDFTLLESCGISAVFAPSVEEVYPDKDEALPSFDLGSVAEVMEGKFRPGHFAGVAQIVSKLFNWVRPDRAYFGEKDFQQIAVIRRMVSQLDFEAPEIVACPIKRDHDGLALSSRNLLLSDTERKIAPEIYRILSLSVEYSKNHSVASTHDSVVESIDSLPNCKVEYFEIVDGISLMPVSGWDDSEYIVGCITVYCGQIRLIDNISYRKPE